uniref:Out at first C-terminal domain-containing protein n=1 Tax=Phlebotomus papatasi TaxID=29031 RepID=A0A1B0GMV5_PHLPP
MTKMTCCEYQMSILSPSESSSISNLEAALRQFPPTKPSRCSEVSGVWAPCTCFLEMCIGWYPCGLKYCKGKAEDNALASGTTSYRCGIKTCQLVQFLGSRIVGILKGVSTMWMGRLEHSTYVLFVYISCVSVPLCPMLIMWSDSPSSSAGGSSYAKAMSRSAIPWKIAQM